MPRVISWYEPIKGLHIRKVTITVTKDDWKKRYAMMNTKLQKCSVVKAYRKWLKETR